MDLTARELTLLSVGLTLYAAVQALASPLELIAVLFTPGAVVVGMMRGVLPSRAWWVLYSVSRVDFLAKFALKLPAFASIKLGFPGIQIPFAGDAITWLAAYCIATELAGPFAAHWTLRRIGLYARIPPPLRD